MYCYYGNVIIIIVDTHVLIRMNACSRYHLQSVCLLNVSFDSQSHMSMWPVTYVVKKTIFNNNQYTLNIDPDPTHAIDENTIKRNMKTIHTTIVQDHLSNRPINKLLNRPPPDIDKKEETLPHSTRRKLSQLRTNKSPLLMTYLHKIDPANHPAANCPLCNDPNHDSLHLFNCPDIPTTLTVWDLWTDPVGVAALLDVWGEKLGGPRAGV